MECFGIFGKLWKGTSCKLAPRWREFVTRVHSKCAKKDELYNKTLTSTKHQQTKTHKIFALKIKHFIFSAHILKKL